MSRIIEKELSYRLTGLLFKLQAGLGRFCREKQYADGFENLLDSENISYRREVDLSKIVENSPKGNRADFVIENKIIIDFKAKQFITRADYDQMQRYLNALNIELGMIVNMRNYNLRPKRVLNASLKDSGHSASNSGH